MNPYLAPKPTLCDNKTPLISETATLSSLWVIKCASFLGWYISQLFLEHRDSGDFAIARGGEKKKRVLVLSDTPLNLTHSPSPTCGSAVGALPVARFVQQLLQPLSVLLQLRSHDVSARTPARRLGSLRLSRIESETGARPRSADRSPPPATRTRTRTESEGERQTDRQR